jgi:hypothetical protein
VLWRIHYAAGGLEQRSASILIGDGQVIPVVIIEQTLSNTGAAQPNSQTPEDTPSSVSNASNGCVRP